jgi:5-methylthioadenosine/S-adenosylhomocysteine deaminase
MPVVLADLSIEARWIVPMTMPGKVLEHHTLVVRDGRILDLLPSPAAAARYAATVVVQRPAHLLMPGMINAATHAARSLFVGTNPGAAAVEQRLVGPEFVRDGVLTAIAEMLRAGVTCFGDRYYFPDETARIACEQGMRAVIGLPVAETASPWAQSAAEYLTRALAVRDDYKDHPLISTAFALDAPGALSDATFARVATLADELDAGIVIDLHASARDIAQSVAAHGVRPIERLWNLGLLTPALNAVYMTHANAADIHLAQRTGMAVTLSPQSSIESEGQLPAALGLAACGIRLGLAADGGVCRTQDLWREMNLLALLCGSAWDALIAATRGGAAAVGLDAHVGALEPGKWADVCCIEFGGPDAQALNDPVTSLVYGGHRDMVSDVWVAGRQLLAERELIRLDQAAAAARARAWTERLNTGR